MGNEEAGKFTWEELSRQLVDMKFRLGDDPPVDKDSVVDVLTSLQDGHYVQGNPKP